MLHAGHPGFLHAAVTKAVISLTVLFTIFGSILNLYPHLILHLPQIVYLYQIWRPVTHNLIFTTPGELLFGSVLLFFFRQFERQMGSSRFAAHTLITAALHTIFLLLVQFFFPTVTPAPGPYALIFSSLIHFFFETPKIYRFELLNTIHLSDKSFAYLLALQLICSTPPRSFLSTASALVAGILYRLPILHHREIPEPLANLSSKYLLPLLFVNPRQSRHRSRRQHRQLRTRNGAQPISESNIETLVSMGFSREQSIAALNRSRDDVHRATEQLLAS